MAAAVRRFFEKLHRTKNIGRDLMETQLNRCLSTFDISLLGIGHMVGSGVYVLTASVAKDIAGPGIVLAFVISGMASLLAALCYAEFSVRFPRAGSAYSYTYLALGEFWAFIVGWNVVLENVIGVAAVSRACSAYLDSLSGGVIHNITHSAFGTMDYPFLSDHLDVLAMSIVVAFVLVLTAGVRVTSHLNNIFSLVNICVILVIICVGWYYADIKNWTNPATGGFLPFGWKGVLAASASCFYAYIGFDAIATSGEEAKEPQKSIPIATFIAMAFATLSYVGVSAVLTLMVSYKDITNDAGLPDALAAHGAMWAKAVVIIGAVCGMVTVLIGTLYALTRIVYAMADDGLLFTAFAKVSEKTQIPIIAMYTFAIMSALLALTLDIKTLVEMMSIGTLLAYLVVSASVVIVRYQPTNKLGFRADDQELGEIGADGRNGDKCRLILENTGRLKDRFTFLHRTGLFNQDPGLMVTICMVAMIALIFLLCALAPILVEEMARATWWAILVVVIVSLLIATMFAIITMHDQNPSPLRYKVPFVPLLPTFSIVCNAALMTNLQALTWIRLLIWVSGGLVVYFGYGMRHSKLNSNLPTSPSSSLLSAACQMSNKKWGSVDDSLCLRDPLIDDTPSASVYTGLASSLP